MTATINEDGSISTKTQVLLKELEQASKSMEIRSEALRNDQARLDSFMSNIKWMLSVVGALIIAAFAGVGYFGFSSINDLEDRVKSSAAIAVDQRITALEDEKTDFELIASQYEGLEADYETYRTWADALLAVASETDFSSRDSKHAYDQVNEISVMEAPTREDRVRALALLEPLIQSGTNGEADPNDLFNAGVSASRLGMNREALKLAVLASHTRPTISHRAFELQMEELFGTRFTFDETSRELIESDLSPDEVRQQAWAELLDMISQAPRIESEQAYSRAANVAVRNRSEGSFRELIDVIEASAVTHSNQLTSYAYQTLAGIYAWESAPDWEQNFWTSIEASVRLLAQESPSASWVEHTARELLQEAQRVNQLPRLLKLASDFDVDLVGLADL